MRFLNPDFKKRVESKLSELNKPRPLLPSAVKKLQQQFEIEVTYNSNGIEGNSLTLKETCLDPCGAQDQVSWDLDLPQFMAVASARSHLYSDRGLARFARPEKRRLIDQ